MDLTDIKNLKVPIVQIHNETCLNKNITLSILRLDQVDSEIAGNKIFKLHYFLKQAIDLNKQIITFGGAFSNHLAATAAACKRYDIECVGIVRGEKPKALSNTLLYCLEKGMQLEFISRNSYSQKTEQPFYEELQTRFGDHVLIPESGFNSEGVKGAALICKCFTQENFTHICCPAGTATTLAGLISSVQPSQHIIGFSALKNLDFEKRLKYLLCDITAKNYSFVNDYHFEGFAKKSPNLIKFINNFYDEYNIQLDFVYTAKMMFGVCLTSFTKIILLMTVKFFVFTPGGYRATRPYRLVL